MDSGEDGTSDLTVRSTDTTEAYDVASKRPHTEANSANAEEKREYTSRFLVAFSFFTAAILSIVWVFYGEISLFVEQTLQLTLSELLTISLGLLSAIVGSAIFLSVKFFNGFIIGLTRSSSNQRSVRNVEESVYEVKTDRLKYILNEEMSRINTLRKETTALETVPANSKSVKKIVSELKSEIEKRITQDFLESSAEKVILAIGEGKAKSLNDRMHEIQDLSLRRLGRQVEVLGVRANRNQYLGICFAVIGLCLLYASFFSDVMAPEDSGTGSGSLTQFMEHYVPRLSLVILVEVVAFFFLRLYTKTLVELRYVQNEITNLEIRFLALHSALNHADDAVISQVIGLLAATDRNAVIDKSQTTVDIEKERAASEGSVATLRAVGELLHGTEKGWFGMKRS